MKNIILTAISTGILAMASNLGAQDAVSLRLDPGSEIVISGSSTLHEWSCKTSAIEATVMVDKNYTKDISKISRPLVSVSVTIPVKSLACGKGQMDKNMYKVLKADEYKFIKYTMTGYELLEATPAGFAAATQGTLTISGKDKAIDMKVTATRDNEKASAGGEQTLLLTDFGIKPPAFMLGTLKVGNQIKVKFNLKAGPATMAKLAQSIN